MGLWLVAITVVSTDSLPTIYNLTVDSVTL
jgi:hypothetical protein